MVELKLFPKYIKFFSYFLSKNNFSQNNNNLLVGASKLNWIEFELTAHPRPLQID